MPERPRPAYMDPEQIVPISRESTSVFKTGAWIDTRPHFSEKTSPCRAACPNGNDIAVAAGKAADGDFSGALAAFLEESPLPGTCGRVCYHPCQTACNRVVHDGSVRVRALERAAADHGRAQPTILSDAGQSEPVAVVGSGPAGLACAYHLARMGHPVTIYESAEKAGGLLTRGIPEFRLPGAVFQADLGRILDLPITLLTGRPVDAGFLQALTVEHRSVFLGLGADAQVSLGLPGEGLADVINGLDFLRDVSRQARAAGARVAVIGGGNTALDAARVAIRAGAQSVTVLYRRARDQMPAFADEVAEAQAEGIEIEFLVGPVQFLEEGRRLAGIRLGRLELGQPDDSGRARPVPSPNQDIEFACDLAIVAAGQKPYDHGLVSGLRWANGRIWIDGLGQTSRPGLFAGGDVTPVKASVVDALASGKRAALGIHLALISGLDHEALQTVTLGPGPSFTIEAFFRPKSEIRLDQVAKVDRLTVMLSDRSQPRDLPEADVASRVTDHREVALGLDIESARLEAERCLRCGTCVNCDRCRIYCPEGSMAGPPGPGQPYRALDDYCKGCNLCASVCLPGVMEPGGRS